jgi:hypothetical protein
MPRTPFGLIAELNSVISPNSIQLSVRTVFVAFFNSVISPNGVRCIYSTMVKHRVEVKQVNLAEQLTSSDCGDSTVLIDQNYWANSKWYYVHVECGNAADKSNGRNSNVSFTKNSNVPSEVMTFMFCSDEITIEVKSGIATRKN